MEDNRPNIAAADALMAIFGYTRVTDPWPTREQIREALNSSTVSQWWDMPLYCEPCGPAPISASAAAIIATPNEVRRRNGHLRPWLTGSIGEVKLGEANHA